MTSTNGPHNPRVASLLARNEIRRGWRGALGVALVLGTLWGLSLGTAIGARRNATAFDRMTAQTTAFDVLVNPQAGSSSKLQVEDVGRLPGVEAWDVFDGHFATVVKSDDLSAPGALVLSTRFGRIGSTVEQLVMFDGRFPAAAAIDEVLVNPEFLRTFRVRIGDSFQLALHDLSTPTLKQQRVRIVGVGRVSDEGVKEGGAQVPRALLSPAFDAKYPESRGFFGVVVRLRPGTDVNAFKLAVNALAPAETISYETRIGLRHNVQRSTRPQTIALVAFAGVLGIAGLLAAVQLVAPRSARRRTEQGDALHALGLTRRDSARIGLLATAPVLALAGVVAGVVAVVASAWFPVSVARRLEVHRGVQFHVIAMLLGLALPTLVVLTAAALSALRTRGTSPARAARDGLVGPWPFALAVRSARRAPRLLGSTALACGLGVGALVFAASATSYVTHPAREGWRWDSLAGFNAVSSDQEPAVAVLAPLGTSDRISASSIVQSGQTPVGTRGTLTSIIGFGVLKGDAIPTVLSGRMPGARNEVAVGELVQRSEHLRIGSTLRVGEGSRAQAMRVVGTVVVPGLGFYPGTDSPTVGGSIVTTLDSFNDVMAPGASVYVALRFAPSVPIAERAGLVAATIHAKPEDVEVQDYRANVDTVAIAAVRRTPYLLAAVLAFLTLVTLTQALYAESRRRRPMLAVLSALGARSVSLRRYVVIHAVLVVLGAIVTGTVVGLLVGRRIWGATAYATGIAAGHVVPVVHLVLAAVVALVLGIAAALVPARHGAAVNTSAVLRAE